MLRRWFYGWYIVLVASLGNFMATGTGFYLFNAFMGPLCAERRFSRTAVNAGPMLASLLGLVTPMFYGYLLRRAGPRRIMIVGPLVGGAAFAFLGRVTTVWEFFLFYLLLGLGNAGMSGMVANAAISNWFIRKRGRAMGLATAASSLAGVVLPYFALLLLTRLPLSHAFLVIGLLSLLVSPAAALLVRDRPEDHGLMPDGVPSGKRLVFSSADGPQPGAAADSGLWTFPLLLRCGTFWKLGTAYALIMMGVVGVMFQLAPRFKDLGFNSSAAMALLAATALLGSLGKYVWGVLCDRRDARKVATGLMALITVGLVFGLLPPSRPAVAVFVLIFGFAMGGAMSTFPIMIAEFFGRESFARAASYLYILLALQGLGYIVMGQSYDRTGSYDPAYGVFIVLSAVATVLIYSLRRPRLPAEAA